MRIGARMGRVTVSAARDTNAGARAARRTHSRRSPAPDWSGADLRPRRWGVFWPVHAQGVCWAIQLSDRRDRVLLLVMSVLVRTVIQQVENPHLCGGNPYF